MRQKLEVWFVLIAAILALSLSGCSKGKSPEEMEAAKAQSPKDVEKAAEKSKEGGGLLSGLIGPEMKTVPNGSSLTVRLAQSLSTERNNDGDRFQATLDRSLVVDGKVLAPAGSTVHGTVYHAKESGKVKGRAELGLTLNSIVVGGKSYSIDTNNWFRQAPGTKKRDATIIGGGTGVGAAIGAIAGGKKGAAIGAAVGGGAGTGTVLATRGKPVVLPAESRLTFRLQRELKLPVS